jgi:Uma2 family endonuclease
MTEPAYAWRAPEADWTAADLQNLPTDGHRYEVVDGCLHATPTVTDGHQEIVDEIVAALRSAAPPGWRPISRVGVRIAGSCLMPDAVVLRPGSRPDGAWAEPNDLALVVEVESAASRRFDRCLKPGLYADADIESYWRIECTSNGPVAHLYTRAAAGHYQLHRSVNTGECVVAELPYAVQVAPATWV